MIIYKGGFIVKKYVLFSIRFIILFTLFQVLSGLLLTITYTPHFSSANLSNQTSLTSSSSPFLLTLLIAFLSATIAYFIPAKIVK